MVLKSIEQLRRGLHDALSWGEDVAERLALAEVDAVVQTRVQGILIPSLVVAVLFAAVEVAAAMIGDAETLRVAVTSIVLAAGVYGVWALATGIVDVPADRRGVAFHPADAAQACPALPLSAHPVAPAGGVHQCGREVLDRRPDRPLCAEILRPAFELGGAGLPPRRPDRAAHGAPRRLADGDGAHSGRAWPGPIIASQIFPDIIRSQTGLGIWSAFLYPGAALIDLIAGTSLRAGLLG